MATAEDLVNLERSSTKKKQREDRGMTKSSKTYSHRVDNYIMQYPTWKENGKIKLMIIVGTKPEIIRLAAVIKKCRK